jgi:glycosyltransferase involved in cell wall biosynthesis
MESDFFLSESFPLVTVICLCYNHDRFVKEALLSVKKQTYPNIQLIIVDDKSVDESVHIIKGFIKENPDIEFIENTENLGNCKSFNRALVKAKGKYIIDLSADDILIDDRIKKQVTILEKLDESYGVIFSDAWHTNEEGKPINRHYENISNIPSGDIYQEILARYFICTPTMMIKKIVLDELNGYDENLAYEDFDFWVRSSRKWKYYFHEEVTTLKRKVTHSLSTHFKERKNKLQESTWQVCLKAYSLNHSVSENLALAKRIRYELRQCFIASNYKLVLEYNKLLRNLHQQDFLSKLIDLCALLLVYFHKNR